MKAIKINRDTLSQIRDFVEVMGDVDVMEEFIDIFDRYFIKELIDHETGQIVKHHWATMSEEDLRERFDCADWDLVQHEFVSISYKEPQKFMALEIKTEIIFNAIKALVGPLAPRIKDATFEETKGKFIVFDYPSENEYELVDPAFWDDSGFAYIENGPVIRLKMFTRKDVI